MQKEQKKVAIFKFLVKIFLLGRKFLLNVPSSNQIEKFKQILYYFFMTSTADLSVNSYKKFSEHIGMFCHSTNIGVLNTEDSIYLIDTGTCAEDAKNLLASLNQIFPGKKVKEIFNTHSHSDHCGGNSYIVEKTNCTVNAPYLESLIMQFPYLMGAMYWGAYPFESLKVQNFVNQTANKVDRIFWQQEQNCQGTQESWQQKQQKQILLKSPQKIELGELCIEIVSLPGHYFDQVGFLVSDKSENKKAFFLGDGFFGIPLLKRFWIPFIYEPEDFRKSIEKIEEIFADFYIPGHGDVCTNENLEAVAEFNIIVTLEFEKLIKKLLLKNPQNQEELLKSVADYAGLELKESNYILIGTTLRSYLSSMNRRGILEHKIVENRLIWSVAV